MCPVVGLMDMGIEEGRIEAELLLSQVLGTDRSHLLANLQEPLPADALASLVPLIERRLVREPLSYLLGWREFYGLRFSVRPGVLIPRPDTRGRGPAVGPEPVQPDSSHSRPRLWVRSDLSFSRTASTGEPYLRYR